MKRGDRFPVRTDEFAAESGQDGVRGKDTEAGRRKQGKESRAGGMANVRDEAAGRNTRNNATVAIGAVKWKPCRLPMGKVVATNVKTQIRGEVRPTLANKKWLT